MFFNNFTLGHKAIYFGGIICLVVLNIYQLHQFQSEVALNESIAKNNPDSSTVYYVFISEYGSCDLNRLALYVGDDYNERLHTNFSIKKSEAPCTVQNYYLLGKGILYLASLPVFLLLFPLFSGSNLNQRIYNRAFYISLSTIFLMVLNLFYEFFYNPVPKVELLTWGGLIVYLCFLLNGWGRHRENLSRFLLLTTTLFMPLIWIWIALLFSNSG